MDLKELRDKLDQVLQNYGNMPVVMVRNRLEFIEAKQVFAATTAIKYCFLMEDENVSPYGDEIKI